MGITHKASVKVISHRTVDKNTVFIAVHLNADILTTFTSLKTFHVSEGHNL